MENKNWALALAEEMENADIEWKHDPDLSERSREYFEQYVYEKWLRTQSVVSDSENSVTDDLP